MVPRTNQTNLVLCTMIKISNSLQGGFWKYTFENAHMSFPKTPPPHTWAWMSKCRPPPPLSHAHVVYGRPLTWLIVNETLILCDFWTCNCQKHILIVKFRYDSGHYGVFWQLQVKMSKKNSILTCSHLDTFNLVTSLIFWLFWLS